MYEQLSWKSRWCHIIAKHYEFIWQDSSTHKIPPPPPLLLHHYSASTTTTTHPSPYSHRVSPDPCTCTCGNLPLHFHKGAFTRGELGNCWRIHAMFRIGTQCFWLHYHWTCYTHIIALVHHSRYITSTEAALFNTISYKKKHRISSYFSHHK